MKNIAVALFFTESLVGHKQPCQPISVELVRRQKEYICTAIHNVSYEGLMTPEPLIQYKNF